MSPITSNPNLTVHVCLLKRIKNEQTDEQNRSATKEKYLQGDIYLLIFYVITARHANGIFLCISELAHMACGMAIWAHKMCLKTENYDIFYQIWKLKLKFTIKCQNQDERTFSLLPRRSLKAFYWIPKPVLKCPQDWKLIDKDILLTKPSQSKSQKQQLKNENEIHLPVLAECHNPTRVELSLSLQPWFLPIKEGLAYQMTRFYVNKLSTTTSFGISK